MVFYEKVIKLYKLELISDSAIYKNSMDYVRLNELNGYHLNERTIEDLDKSAFAR